jgi:O-antigen/teichoic acid export membrane protein
LIDTVYNELRQLIIGKLYSSKSLAYYDKGKQFPNSLMKNIDASIDSVLLPALSSEQDNMSRIKTLTRRSIKTSSYILWPLMLGLAACATPLIRLILTEKWLPCVPFLQIFCITFALQPIQTANLNAIKAIGQSGLFLRLNIIKKIIGIFILLVTMKLGVLVMALSLLATTVINGIINAFPNKKLLNYSYIDQLKDILPGILLAVFMGICVYPIQLLSLPDIITLIIQVILGAAIYIAGSVILKLDSFEYLWGTVKSIIKKH